MSAVCETMDFHFSTVPWPLREETLLCLSLFSCGFIRRSQHSLQLLGVYKYLPVSPAA